MKKISYTVIYRTGGKINFTWKKTLPYRTINEAFDACIDIKKMGYPAYIGDKIPITYYTEHMPKSEQQ